MSVVVFLGNGIGAEGAKAIGEALKTNKTVTTVNLGGEKCFLFMKRSRLNVFESLFSQQHW